MMKYQKSLQYEQIDASFMFWVTHFGILVCGGGGPWGIEGVEGHGRVQHMEAFRHPGHEVHFFYVVDKISGWNQGHLHAAKQDWGHGQAVGSAIFDPANYRQEQLQLTAFDVAGTRVEYSHKTLRRQPEETFQGDDLCEVLAKESVDTIHQILQSMFDGDIQEHEAILQGDVTKEVNVVQL